MVFKPVKADVGGNLEKMKAALERAPADTVHKALLAEKAAGNCKDKNSMAVAVLWYKRAMQFIFAIMKKVAAGQEANAAAKEAYEETLSAYHGFMVKKTFKMGLMGAPGTDSRLNALGVMCVCVCVCVYVCVCVCVCVYRDGTYIHTCIHACVHRYRHMMYARAHTYRHRQHAQGLRERSRAHEERNGGLGCSRRAHISQH